MTQVTETNTAEETLNNSVLKDLTVSVSTDSFGNYLLVISNGKLHCLESASKTYIDKVGLDTFIESKIKRFKNSIGLGQLISLVGTYTDEEIHEEIDKIKSNYMGIKIPII